MWNLIKNEWEKIPQTLRLCIEIGIGLVFNAWVLDHWTSTGSLPYKYLGQFDLREASYNIGMTFIYFAIIAIVFKLIINLPELINNYKTKYQIKNIGKTFDLVWFSGKLILFDHKIKRFYHVYPWETAQDLDFVSFGTHVEDHFPNPTKSKIKMENGKILDTAEYQNGGSINTRI